MIIEGNNLLNLTTWLIVMNRGHLVADGTPEEPALLTVAMDTNAETDMLCAMLRSYDIPVLRKYEGEGSFGKIVLGMPGSGTWLYVPSSMLEDAKNLIRPIDEIPEQEDMQ